MHIVNDSVSSYLVIYGGASPETGPLDDTYYALLPDPDSIGNSFTHRKLYCW